MVLGNLYVDSKCHADTCHVDAKEAASALMNISISNMHWLDFKEQEAEEFFQPPSSVDAKNAVENPSGEMIWQIPRSAPEHVFAVYTCAGANMTMIQQQLDSDWKNRHPMDPPCRVLGSYPNFAKVIKMHPWNCQRSSAIYPYLFICADKKHVESEGVLLVQETWDGNIERDPADLIQIVSNIAYRTYRCHVSKAIALLMSIVSGDRGFDQVTQSSA